MGRGKNQGTRTGQQPCWPVRVGASLSETANKAVGRYTRQAL